MKIIPFVAAASVVLLSACASTPKAASAAAPSSAPVTAGSSTGNSADLKPAQQLPEVDARAAEAAAFAGVKGKSVYFDFDQSSIRDGDRASVEAHAGYLSKYKTHVLIQGNTDARGSREYNLALGQRRSESVKQALEVLGVKSDQIEAVSLGKEKPRATGTTEQDYAENRRADFVYP
ncbi:OmpA family protein [Vogesella sp. LIG4]|uniref:OmpA family protein n=1 Tax=Vogesella sp. LIG4 TaxID=1192162 RepID=UPI00081FC42B|nr:OmpA family protein [Vogesella sp. LIG4]SCK10591.1 peptidoglycan-associated lipoprotein [Vogesella sp. LIG4]